MENGTCSKVAQMLVSGISWSKYAEEMRRARRSSLIQTQDKFFHLGDRASQTLEMGPGPCSVRLQTYMSDGTLPDLATGDEARGAVRGLDFDLLGACQEDG